MRIVVEFPKRERNYFGVAGLHLTTAKPLPDAAEATSPI
jgi:hypothetical protein